MLPGIRACLEVASVRLTLFTKTKGSLKEKVSVDVRGCPVTLVRQEASHIPYQSDLLIISTLSLSHGRERNGSWNTHAFLLFFHWIRKVPIHPVKRLREAHQQFWMYRISCGSFLPHHFCYRVLPRWSPAIHGDCVRMSVSTPRIRPTAFLKFGFA